MEKVYACIDLKSFYASVECVERGLDPLTTNLVVADNTRTEKTICLAVSPPLKAYGLSGRSRLYEVVRTVKQVNQKRKQSVYKFKGKSYNQIELTNNRYLELDYIVAQPRMAYYIDYSTKIYDIYLKYISKDDIFAYSIDEVFIDLTHYLNYYQKTPEQLITNILKDVYQTTGITATAGIGTNLYLAKIAMDIMAKKNKPNKEGVRMAFLDEASYRKNLWSHKPISDFWRVGRGYVKRLEKLHLYTMGDIARFSLHNENKLYKEFGVNAEILIDHAWGYEPCTLKDVKNYKPMNTSLSSGQVLKEPYNYHKARLIVREMIDLLSLDLVSKKFLTNQITLTIGYDISNLKVSHINYNGPVEKDLYGRTVPKAAHGTINLDKYTSSSKVMTDQILVLFDRIVNKKLLVRRINIAVNNLKYEDQIEYNTRYEQFNLFDDYTNFDQEKKLEKESEIKDHKIQKIIIDIKYKYGRNAVIKGMNLCEGATTLERNKEIGGNRE